jgi:ubiquitin-like 1-activating enzyme E1 B
MAGNIIPAIATTNAMTAGLCVLQSFKVLQDDLSQAKMVIPHCFSPKLFSSKTNFFIIIQVFLERSGARAINSDSLDPPKPGCSICSSAHGRVAADRERATLGDLVEILRSDLEYGEELSIVNSAGQVIYDPDLEENLTRKLSEPAITNGFSFLTIRDEDDQDQDPRVNLDLFFVERYALNLTAVTRPDCLLTFNHRQEPASEDSKPVTLQGTLEIPRKPKKKNTEPVFEDASTANGTSGLGKRKRDGEDEVMTNGHVAKKVAGEQANGDSDDLIVLDEEDSGAILIDD